MKGMFFPYKDENRSKNRPYVTYALIAVNVAVFLWSLTDFESIISSYGFTPVFPSILALFTSMFLHGGIDHIFGNMWYLFIFGDNVEDRLGRIKYIMFYLASGIAATALHYLTNLGSAAPAIGASGAISGVLGAYIIFYPKVRVHVAQYGGTIPASVVIGFWFVLQLIFGAVSLAGGTGSGIAFFAHIGGFIFGAAVAWFLFKARSRES